MPDLRLRPATAADHPRLTDVWRAAVEATHDFLSPDDVAGYAARMAPEFLPQLDVTVAEADGRIVGFSGRSGSRIEMVFVDPAEHGGGVGTLLLDRALAECGVLELDVNEQNPAAVRFYLARGFTQTGRSPVDSDGRPFPLLHLRKEGVPVSRGDLRLADGRTLAWSSCGPADGQPVLFVAGAGSGRSMTFGRDLLAAEGVRLVTADRPGMGGSTPHAERTLQSTAEDLRQLVESQGGRMPVVANSQGAPFGLALALTGVVERLVLASPADEVAHPPVLDQLPEQQRAVVEQVAADRDGVTAFLSTLGPEGMESMVLGGSDEEDLAAFRAPAFLAEYRAALREGFANSGAGYIADTLLAMSPWQLALDEMPCDVEILVGARDLHHSPDQAETLASRIRGARRRVVPDAGGALLWTHSDEVLSAALGR